ncbi:hypothetical protein GPECTOR_246g601 [Gonium pectorale]|uniref:Protein kinase domain-containing protein n=1 Tax=Gonium pectorale TaxID=33097 RepID=A0A150FWF4_GONPE|nr:hypothetical protein GPECTOR_246g601 [Gonium pectorale]|eukprot:KXZ41908.1 hypothetical protein GPECTOR_246g601 [Gonium pectorale]
MVERRAPVVPGRWAATMPAAKPGSHAPTAAGGVCSTHYSNTNTPALVPLPPSSCPDLKPANVLIADAGSDLPVAKLGDFGLSRLASTVLITHNPEVGTVPYMAPEIFEPSNHEVTDRADIYALGVLLWEMLSGCRPWEGNGLVQVAYTVTALHKRLPMDAIPPERRLPKLEVLINECWDAIPARRPAAAEVVKALALAQERCTFCFMMPLCRGAMVARVGGLRAVQSLA